MARIQAGRLILQKEGSEIHFRLSDNVTTIGRSKSCAIYIPASTVSRVHAQLEIQHDRYLLADAKSANGTFLNGVAISSYQQLNSGDEIWLGSKEVELVFHDPEETLSISLNDIPPPLAIDESARTVEVYGLNTQLSPLEYRLLIYLAHNSGMVCTREHCFLHIWGQSYDHSTCEDALNACVAKLRRNLRAIAQITNQSPPQITTIQRVGFRLDTAIAFVTRTPMPSHRLCELEVG